MAGRAAGRAAVHLIGVKVALVAAAILGVFVLVMGAALVGGGALGSDAAACGPTAPSAFGGWGGKDAPPRRFQRFYVEAAERYGLGPRGPAILASIHRIESGFGALNDEIS
ncbi:MAG: hypothetical protein GEU88_17435, partial [Solirubrobacterales bacterium]|nr:hypothetical protein [Solirubrobacterales bacterium]